MKTEYTCQDVLDRLPHRAPMLMVDGILELSAETCTAYKQISFSEPCFQGHFPGQPMFPGVLMIEAMAQTCALCMSEQQSPNLPVFAGVSNTRFLKPVTPGCQLVLKAVFVEQKNRFYTFKTMAYVNEEEVCQAELTIYK